MTPTTTRHAALATIQAATRGRVRTVLPRDADGELCKTACFDPSKCDGRACFVTSLVKQTARARAVVGAPGRRIVDAAAVYNLRTAKRTTA